MLVKKYCCMNWFFLVGKPLLQNTVFKTIHKFFHKVVGKIFYEIVYQTKSLSTVFKSFEPQAKFSLSFCAMVTNAQNHPGNPPQNCPQNCPRNESFSEVYGSSEAQTEFSLSHSAL